MFLKCNPTVFVIGKEYEIAIFSKTNGLCFLEIDGKKYYEQNSGVLCTEKNFYKIRVPQAALDSAGSYDVVFRSAINRKAYYSELGQEERVSFSFKALKKTADINVYHVADVHYLFEHAVNTCSYFGDDIDLFIVNGDIGEVEKEQDFFDVLKFVGDISKGQIPVIFVRGNHDTRGKLAERYTDYFPVNGKDTFFSFEVGSLCGVALDCGEDKPDDHEEYGGVNVFEPFRRRETEFLNSLELPKDKLAFAICHICPVMTTLVKGIIFDIERDVYSVWNKNLERLNVKFMITGHLHNTFIVNEGDERSTLPHAYPVIVGSGLKREPVQVVGTAMTINSDGMVLKFTDQNKKVIETHQLKY